MHVQYYSDDSPPCDQYVTDRTELIAPYGVFRLSTRVQMHNFYLKFVTTLPCIPFNSNVTNGDIRKHNSFNNTGFAEKRQRNDLFMYRSERQMLLHDCFYLLIR